MFLVATAMPLPSRGGNILLMILIVQCPTLLQLTFVIFSTNLETALFARNADKFPLHAYFLVFWLNKILHRKVKDTGLANWPSNICFVYSQKMSTTSLHPHIEKYHCNLYLSLAKKRGWKIQLPGLQLQAWSQVASETTALQAGQLDKFDENTFHQYLVKFIVVNNQVCYCF